MGYKQQEPFIDCVEYNVERSCFPFTTILLHVYKSGRCELDQNTEAIRDVFIAPVERLFDYVACRWQKERKYKVRFDIIQRSNEASPTVSCEQRHQLCCGNIVYKSTEMILDDWVRG